MKYDILGGLPFARFLRRHWQKEPLLVRNAIPRFDGLLDFDDMISLACRDDCESRLVLRSGKRWLLKHGPFRREALARLPRGGWTLLVQGVENHLPEARSLLSKFSFIPCSRLDDLMVSYAPPGGGVGPHFDSYDVFLLQGPGRRRWRVSRQSDLELVAGAPLKILRRFKPEAECVLDPGDMLYLPPRFAHDGIAITDCYTYSIGFRAPSHRELMSQFLVFLEDRLSGTERYGDPDLRTQMHPAAISPAMIGKIERMLGQIRWDRGDVVEFLGRYLTEPKAHVRFSAPRRPHSESGFLRRARERGVELALASQMLYSGDKVFINGEPVTVEAGLSRQLRPLADSRRLPGRRIPATATAVEVLYRWYRDGYISLSTHTALR